ncbi:hypothetical protein ES703_35639 [subsurface metagenome]
MRVAGALTNSGYMGLSSLFIYADKFVLFKGGHKPESC